MKSVVQVLRFLVGVLFIFSGVVKANDPLGLAYKMEEYFDIWRLYALTPYATSFSISMNALEIMSGAALLLGWQNKWNLRLLLALILFFTGLTGYTFYTGYPKTCGCFGDCLPITSAVSFYKDVLLFIGITIVYYHRSFLKPILAGRAAMTAMGVISAGALGLEFYVLHHLPVVDCLPYKVGTNISEARKQPPPPPGSTVMFVYEKGGQEIEFPADRFPADFSPSNYRFIRRFDTGELPQAPIQGFLLKDSIGNDVTDAILSLDRSIVIFTQSVESFKRWDAQWKAVYDAAKERAVPIIVVSNRTQGWEKIISETYPSVRVVNCDRTPIRTAARVDPTLYYLEKGTIAGKWALPDWYESISQLKSIP